MQSERVQRAVQYLRREGEQVVPAAGGWLVNGEPTSREELVAYAEDLSRAACDNAFGRPSRAQDPAIRQVLGAVARAAGVSVEALTGPSRRRAVAEARRVAYHLLREAGLSWPQVAAALERQDHSTPLKLLARRAPDAAIRLRAEAILGGGTVR